MKSKKIIIITCISIIFLILITTIIYKKLKSQEIFNAMLPRINQANEYIDNQELDKALKALEDLKENSNDNSKIIKQIVFIEKRLDIEKKKHQELEKKQETEHLEEISKINQLLNEDKLDNAEKLAKELSNKNINNNVKSKLEESNKLLQEKKLKIQLQNKINKVENLIKENKLTEAEKEIKEIDVNKLSKENLTKLEQFKNNIKKKKEDNNTKNISKNLGQLRKMIVGNTLVAPNEDKRWTLSQEYKNTGYLPPEYGNDDSYFCAIGKAGFESPNSTMVKPNILYKGKPAYTVTIMPASTFIEGGTAYSEFVVDINGVQYQGDQLRNSINSNQVLDINTKKPVEFNPGKIKDW